MAFPTSHIRLPTPAAAPGSSSHFRLPTPAGASASSHFWRRTTAAAPVYSHFRPRTPAAASGPSHFQPRTPAATRSDWISDGESIPVFVMLPLNATSVSGQPWMKTALQKLKKAGVEGVMVDVWWGEVETAPRIYEWEGYRRLFDVVVKAGLKLQVVTSFHECGGNVGDDTHIPLPPWVLEEEGKGIFFTDRGGYVNTECLTWGVDRVKVVKGRSAVEIYADFFEAFRAAFEELFTLGLICEVEVGLGPCGELRYPSYPAKNGWIYPGVGEFQCYDPYLRESLRAAAVAKGEPSWAEPPHSDSCGVYNYKEPEKLPFFKTMGEYNSFRGRFFLGWYSGILLSHADAILGVARKVFGDTTISAKVAGVHWHYKCESHPAELTAGFYNTLGTPGYGAIMGVLKKHNAVLNFTCVELSTKEQKGDANSDPEALVWQVIQEAWAAGVPVAAENALPCHDRAAYELILSVARPKGAPLGSPRLVGFTYLRLSPALVEEAAKWKEFSRFVDEMR